MSGKVIDFGKSTTVINMVVTQDRGAGDIAVLYQQAIKYELPRPCPVGIQAKTRTQAVVTLLQQATLALMAACGVAMAPAPPLDQDGNLLPPPEPPEGTHDEPEADGGFTEA
jgi:hypothetical protein